MARSAQPKQLGWGNQPRVILYSNGVLALGDITPPSLPLIETALWEAAGDGVHNMAMIVDDQTGNPFREARITLANGSSLLTWLEALMQGAGADSLDPAPLQEIQRRQMRASVSVVLLSLVEYATSRTSGNASKIIERGMQRYFEYLEEETDTLLQEKMAINLDWILRELPAPQKMRAEELMGGIIPEYPPYSAWFNAGATTLRIDWKCGSEFFDGWLRRLQEVGFALASQTSEGEAILTKTYSNSGRTTQVEMNLGPERGNVFRYIGRPEYHIVGYDGHSDWGRKIPRSLQSAPTQSGEKAIFYLLCCGKQTLQKVRDQYPKAQIVTTFNSSKFTHDFRYSEDFSAFVNILDGISRRESWLEIRNRVNRDWYNNPEKNYLFPAEALAMARSLDRDHDGQADMFDKLIDYNTFSVEADARSEFVAREPETPAKRIVGTRLHFATQVFHTLCHFNQLLEGFTHDLRVFADGWYYPESSISSGTYDRKIARVRVEKSDEGRRYFFQGNCHYAHATEETWRAVGALILCDAVMAHEPLYAKISPEDRVLNGLILMCHSLEVDDVPGRDAAVWNQVLTLLGLPPTIQYSTVAAAKSEEHHWYSGSRTAIESLKKGMPTAIPLLSSWATPAK